MCKMCTIAYSLRKYKIHYGKQCGSQFTADDVYSCVRQRPTRDTVAVAFHLR